MNNTLYEITPKLDEIYKKLLTLDKYDFDYTKFKEEINGFDKRISSFDIESNNMTGAKTLSKADDRLINELYETVIQFEKFIDKLINSFTIFNNYKEYQSKIISIKDENELDELISHILNDLLGYIFILKNGLKNNNEAKDINYMLYNAIKKEFQLKGNSIIFNTLLNNGLEKIISSFLSDDVNKYKDDNEIQSRSLNVSFGISDENDIKDLLLLISITDNNYKDGIKKRFNTLNLEKYNTESNIDSNNLRISDNNVTIKDKKNDRNDYIKEILKTYISFFASIAILLGAGNGIYAKAKPQTVKYYRLDKECYDTIDGSYDTTSYSMTYDNSYVLKIYSEVDEKGQRQLTTYYLDDNSDNIEYYLTNTPPEDQIISSTTINDPLINNKSTEEFRTVEKIINVDLESTIEESKGKFALVFYELLLLVFWSILNAISNHFEIGGVAYIFTNEFASWEFGKLKETKAQIKKLINKNKKIFEENEELKSKLNDLLKIEEELDNKYNVYLNILREKEGKPKVLKR